MWRDEATAADILLAAQDIQQFTIGKSNADFLGDRLVQAAVIQCITRMGEATKRLSEDFRASHDRIEWKQIAGMRDRCVHDYDDINFELVWKVVKTDAPAIAAYLGTIVRPPQPE